MKLYFISILTKQDGYLSPLITDSEHLEAACRQAKASFPDATIFLYEAKLDPFLSTYKLGKRCELPEI